LGGEKLNTRRFVFAAAFAVCALIFIFPSAAQSGEVSEGGSLPAEDTILLGDDSPQIPAAGVNSVGTMVRMVLVLAVAALAIYGVVFLIKRLSRPAEAGDPHLKVLARAPLGSGAFTAVVSVGSKAWLVGGGDGGISLIAEIDEQEALESMLIDNARKEAESRRFRFLDFRSLLGKFGGGRETGAPGNSHAETIRRQRDRLKGL
jgi:flagellar protein FliO/FliZ